MTEWGYQSEPIFQAMGRWAARSPHHDPTLPFSAASLVLSLRTMFDPERAAGLTGEIGLRLGVETYRARVANGSFVIEAAPVDGADIVFSGAPSSVAAAIYGGQTLAGLESAGAITLEGDRSLAERFVTVFPLPDKAAPPA